MNNTDQQPHINEFVCLKLPGHRPPVTLTIGDGEAIEVESVEIISNAEVPPTTEAGAPLTETTRLLNNLAAKIDKLAGG